MSMFDFNILCKTLKKMLQKLYNYLISKTNGPLKTMKLLLLDC